MLRSVEEFKQAAKDNGIKEWRIHNCSMCGYPCGYLINGDVVYYDAGCDCVWRPPRESSWEDLADHYNRNQPENNPLAEGKPWLEEMQQFWGFAEPKPKAKKRER